MIVILLTRIATLWHVAESVRSRSLPADSGDPGAGKEGQLPTHPTSPAKLEPESCVLKCSAVHFTLCMVISRKDWVLMICVLWCACQGTRQVV